MESTPDMEARRLALMQRMVQRHANRGVQQTRREGVVEAAISEAQIAIDEGVANEATLRRLEETLELCHQPHDVKRLQDALRDVRARILCSHSQLHDTGFNFSMRKTKKNVDRQCDKESALHQLMNVTTVHHENVANIEQQVGAVLTMYLQSNKSAAIKGKDGDDIKLKQLQKCQLSFSFRPASVTIQECEDCEFTFLPVDASVLVKNCNRCTLVLCAQQLRMHSSHDISLFVAVRAAVIIESCTNVVLAPYQVTVGDDKVEVDENDLWRSPRDFDWLSEEKNPNWSIADQCLWREFQMPQQ